MHTLQCKRAGNVVVKIDILKVLKVLQRSYSRNSLEKDRHFRDLINKETY